MYGDFDGVYVRSEIYVCVEDRFRCHICNFINYDAVVKIEIVGSNYRINASLQLRSFTNYDFACPSHADAACESRDISFNFNISRILFILYDGCLNELSF